MKLLTMRFISSFTGEALTGWALIIRDWAKHIVPITEVVGRYVELRTVGSTCTGLCPFHKEEVPSFTVYPETGTYYCFGCAARGDVIDFLRAIERLHFYEALDALEGWSRHHGGEPRGSQ